MLTAQVLEFLLNLRIYFRTEYSRTRNHVGRVIMYLCHARA